MAVYVDTALEISYAKIAGYLSANEIAYQKAGKGGSLNQNYTRLLYIVRKSIEWKYSVAPTDTTLNDTVTYMIALIGKWRSIAAAIIAAPPCIPPVITSNPSSGSVTTGNNLTLTVVVTGTATIAYQWYKDSVAIVGATSSTYQIISANSGDAGDYTVRVSNSCGIELSSAATITVTSALIGSFYYGNTNYYPDINSGLDVIPYQGTFNITGETLNVPFPAGAASNKFLVVRVPRTQTDKDRWNYDTLNFGDIPDLNFYEVVKPGGVLSVYTYYMTRTQMSLDFPAHTLDLSVSP